MKYKTIRRAIDSSWQKLNEIWIQSERHFSYGMYLLIFIIVQTNVAQFDGHLAQSEHAQTVFHTLYAIFIGLMIGKPLLAIAYGASLAFASTLWQALSVVLILSFVDTQFDAMMTFVFANPEQALSYTVTTIFLLYVLNINLAKYTSYSCSISGEAGVPAALYQRRKLTERDRQVSAIHECGHVMIYALAKVIPSDLRTVIYNSSGSTESLGFVSATRIDHKIQSKSELEFMMYLNLGGIAAEKVRFKEHFSGGSSDIEKWKGFASQYIASGFTPITLEGLAKQDMALESETGNQRLTSMYQEQLFNLTDFFSNNWKVLNELSDKLLAENELDAEALKPYLERVVIPKWMSKVNLVDDIHIDGSSVTVREPLVAGTESPPTQTS